MKKTAFVEFLLPQKRLERPVFVCLDFEIFYGHTLKVFYGVEEFEEKDQTELVSSSEAFKLLGSSS